MIDSLKSAGDHARLQAHLFSLDARKRWEELEPVLLKLRAKLEKGGEEASAAATGKFRDITRAVKEIVDEADGKFGLAVPVRDLMHKAPSTCSPDDPLNRAAQVMWEINCGAVPVTDADGKVVGMITDRDICMAAYTRGQSLPTMTVSSAMSKDVHSCTPEDSIGHAVRLMAQRQVRRIPVVDSGRLVGFLALADIARHIGKAAPTNVHASVVLAQSLAGICEDRPSTDASPRAAAE
jgi:CBS domain-containing protein